MMDNGLKSYSKGIVSIIMGALLIVEQWWGKELGISEEWVTTAIAVIWPLLVFWIPNRD
jgi:hypothetical protein